ncbi:MAG: hypothetical protein HFI35_04280 [Roseburia sp.]|jgi:phage-related protein|nr:hypothetical protein [Roseburia sp.]
MAQYDGSIRIVTKITTKDAEESLASLEWQIKKSAKYIDELRSKMDALKDQKIATKDYKDLQEKLSDAEKELSGLVTKQNEWEKLGISTGDAWDSLNEKIATASDKVDLIKSKMQKLTDDGKDFVLGQDTAQYKAMERQIQYEEDAITKAGDHYKALLSNEKQLNEIKEKSTVADQKMVDLMEERERIASKLAELEAADVTEGYKEYDETYIAWKNATDAVKEYQAQLNKQTEAGKAKEAEKAKREADRQFERQRRISEQAEKNLQKENARIQKEVENEAKLQAKEEARRAKEASAIQAEIAEEERLAQIRNNSVVGNQRIIEAVERRRQLLQEIKDMEAAGIGAGYQQYDAAKQELAELNQEIKEYGNNIGSVREKYKKLSEVAKTSFGGLDQSMKKSGGMMSTLASRFKGLTLSLLIFNQISKAFNAMISGMKEGFGNLYNEVGAFKTAVDGLKASSLTLKNSFAAAFRPLVEIAIPYIQRTMEAISGLMNVIGRFMAVITGQKTYTKAVKQTTAAIEGQTKAQNKQLSSLDKLNNLSSSGGGGGGANSAGMFEEVPVDPKVPSYFEKIAEYAKMLKDVFAQGFWDGLGDWEYRWQSIKDSIGSIKDSLIGIWTDPAVTSGADSWIKSVFYALGSLAGSVASIGLTIGTNLVGGIARYLEESSGRIKGYMVSMFEIGAEINNTIAELSQSVAYIFEAFAGSEGIQLTANILGMILDTLMGISEIALKLSRDVINIFAQPVIDNADKFKTALEGILSVLASVTGTIRRGIDETIDKLNEVYDGHIKPFFDSVALGLSDIVSKFMEFWNGSVQPLLDKWAEKFDVLWSEHIQPMLNNFIELIGGVADMLKAFWDNVLKPLIEWVIEHILPVVLPVMDDIVDGFLQMFGIISDVISDIIDVIRGIVEFLTGVFTGDWQKAWDGIVGIFEGIRDAIFDIVNPIIEKITGFIEKIGAAIQSVKDFWGSGIGNVGGALSSIGNAGMGTIGGRSVFSAIPASVAVQLAEAKIPGYATGQVIPRSMGRHLAILGDNTRETEIVSPLSTIKQANMESMMEVFSRLGLTGVGSAAGDININVTAECDGHTLFQIIKRLDAEQFQCTGRPSFQF